MEYGNLAYKLPEQYDEPIKKRKPQKRKEKTVNTTAVSNKRNHEQMQYKRTIFRGICVTVLLAVSAGFMISKFSDIKGHVNPKVYNAFDELGFTFKIDCCE